MNNENVKEKIKNLKISCSIHSIIYLITITIHILIYYKLIWLSNRDANIFFIEIIIIIAFTFIPVLLFFFFSFLTLTKKFLIILKQLLKILFYVFFLNSMIISISTWNNAQLLSSFYNECPFNFLVEDLPNIFQNYTINNKKEIKKLCKYRRCFYNNNYIKNHKIINNYVCNLEQKDKSITCSNLDVNNLKINDDIINYIEYCNEYTKIYECEKENNFLAYNIPYNYKCPNKSDVNLNYSLSFIFIFIDGFICSMPWLYEYYYIKDLLLLLSININNDNNNNQSLNETNNTSKIDDSNSSQNFEKQPTQTIIIDNLNYKDNKSDILSINKVKKDNNKVNSGNILSNKEINNNNNHNNKEDDKSKSGNRLINSNKDTFNIINKNIKPDTKQIKFEKK